MNYSNCDIEDIHFDAGVSIREKDGTISPLMKCIDTQHWDIKLKKNKCANLDISEYFKIAQESEFNLAPSKGEILRISVLFSVSFRRNVDGKEFCFQEPYFISFHPDGKSEIAKSGQRQKLDTLARHIYRKIE
jgi:hypothetical protein